MKIAYIVPSLANTAPIFIARDLADYFTSLGNEVYVFYFDAKCECRFNCQTFKIRMSDSINFDDFDIIHSHMYRADKYIAKHIKEIHKAITISTVHCNIYEDLKYTYGSIISKIYTPLWIKYLNSINCKVQINDYLLELYKNKLKNNVLIYNGINVKVKNEIDYSKILDKVEELRDKNYNIVCSFSNLNKRKGLIQILRAMLINSHIAYICIGNGPEENKLKKFCLRFKLNNRVFFFDKIPSPYMIIPKIDVFVIPSFSEGFSLALLEAGSMGASVVCSNIKAFTEIFNDNEVTFFRLSNIQSLSKAINIAYENKEIKRKNLLQSIKNKYTLDKMLDKYRSLYNSALTK